MVITIVTIKLHSFRVEKMGGLRKHCTTSAPSGFTVLLMRNLPTYQLHHLPSFKPLVMIIPPTRITSPPPVKIHSFWVGKMAKAVVKGTRAAKATRGHLEV